MVKRVLLTGHGGFVGSHCLEYFLENTDWEIIGIDSFRHKGTVRRVCEVAKDNPRVKTYTHDLTLPIDQQLENLIFDRQFDFNAINFGTKEKSLDLIINMASESAVERSTKAPIDCVKNNVDLAINMLEFTRRNSKLIGQYIQISTDEVYGEASPEGLHKEWSPIMPSNPYAASKAMQEALAISYWRTYNLPIVITNTMNLIGERQDTEKFLPKIIQKIALNEEMPIYGDVNKIGSRIYLHAKDLADALIFISNMKPILYSDFVLNGETHNARPQRFNIVGDEEINNLDLAKLVAKIMNKELKYYVVASESARPGYDRRYGLDGEKLASLGWKRPLGLLGSLEKIVEWSLKNPHWVIS